MISDAVINSPIQFWSNLKLDIMRNFLIVFVIGCFQPGLSQTSSPNRVSSNEIKLDLAHAVGLETLEISYERLLGQKSSLGLSVGYPWSGTSEYRYKFQAIPYYRYHFGRKRANGFFLEGHLALYSEELVAMPNKSVSGVGTGVALGQKFLIKEEWIIELYLGGGINHINTEKINNGYPRFGLSVGKRF